MSNHKLDIDYTYDPLKDVYSVRIRKIYRDENGRLKKRGLVFLISEEWFVPVPEAYDYPVKTLPHRYSDIIDDETDD